MQKQIKNKHIYIYIYNIAEDKHIKAHKHILISNVVLIQYLIDLRK